MLTFAPVPLHGCFEDAGVLGALRRLHRALCADFPAATSLAPGALRLEALELLLAALELRLDFPQLPQVGIGARLRR